MTPPRAGFSRESLPGLRPQPARRREGTGGRGWAGVAGVETAAGEAGGGQGDVAGGAQQEEVEGEGRSLVFPRRAYQALASVFWPPNRRPALASPVGGGWWEGRSLVFPRRACQALASALHPRTGHTRSGARAHRLAP